MTAKMHSMWRYREPLIFNNSPVRREINSYNHSEYNVRDVINVMRKTQITVLKADT